MHNITLMIGATSDQTGIWWLIFSLLTVFCFGVYGNLLHSGQVGMKDKAVGRYKAFLLVGVAYFVVAVLGPLTFLIPSEGGLNFTKSGSLYSFVAGAFGAIGAFGILLAFGAKGTPVVVMSIVFAGAPIINAIASIIIHPPADGIGSIKPMFFVGILLAAIGGGLVTFFKPPPSPGKPRKDDPKVLPPKELANILNQLNTPIGKSKEPRMVKNFPE